MTSKYYFVVGEYIIPYTSETGIGELLPDSPENRRELEEEKKLVYGDFFFFHGEGGLPIWVVASNESEAKEKVPNEICCFIGRLGFLYDKYKLTSEVVLCLYSLAINALGSDEFLRLVVGGVKNTIDSFRGIHWIDLDILESKKGS
jgi:hypothetical protein